MCCESFLPDEARIAGTYLMLKNAVVLSNGGRLPAARFYRKAGKWLKRARTHRARKDMRQLEYKGHWGGLPVVDIDRLYPSGKRCHIRGHRNGAWVIGSRLDLP